MSSKVAVMALSGGMDSTALLVRLLADGYDVHAISYNYGQKHLIEVQRAQTNLNYLSENGYQINHQVIDLTSAMSSFHSALTDDSIDIPEGHYEEEQMKQTVVPNRNAIFASILYGYALSIAIKDDVNVEITLGVHSGDHAIYPDCRPEFYSALEHAFEVGNWESENVTFKLPYIDGDKETILRDAETAISQLGLDFDTIFANTITSYNPDKQGRSSGTSGSDVERILAFHAIGRSDPVQYVKPWDDVLRNALAVEMEYKEMSA
ncbi:MAG: 7-cyano-7-deazaguanine synthase [Methanobacteriota archaeon]|jgi:7-cyano-7-deazaguanine synthase|nr:MAG: 7-cyano-7-deazaguanine synthase [Euryarchaeota archaeon]HIG20867.1 7-cyano-7-deazaguanine synthase [Candidatus Poseidoniales archaeon]